MIGTARPASGRTVTLTVLVAALGYFVDIYDLLLFSIIRVKSLEGIGVSGPDLLEKGVLMLNMQMGGMLLGGILWGMLGDRRGRLSVLFGSITLYSLANIANGLVDSVPAYAVVRFLAGLGLAGELGAGITLVSELMSKETRGYGTAVVASVGVCGAVLAALVGDLVPWRVAYFIGGGLGLALLLLRIGVMESGMFEHVKKQSVVERGNFLALFTSWPRTRRYLSVILIGVPIWYTIAILISLAPELGKAMGMNPAPSASRAVLFSYVGLAVGDLGSGLLSQFFRSRKKIIGAFIGLTAVFIVAYFRVGAASLFGFYAICLGLGFATGYWAVFVTTASEHFGTNIRATVTTTVPNFVRGAVVPITTAFAAGKDTLGVTGSAMLVGAVCVALALIALSRLEETYGKDLDYVDT
jgi:MFS family permease